MVSELILGATMAAGVAFTDIDVSYNDLSEWEQLGKCRITCYCPSCNDGSGHESASGKYLEYGDCACSWLPVGTIVSIEGEEFEVVDICGTDAIDIFIDDSDGCNCNLNEWRYVSVKKEGSK